MTAKAQNGTMAATLITRSVQLLGMRSSYDTPAANAAATAMIPITAIHRASGVTLPATKLGSMMATIGADKPSSATKAHAATTTKLLRLIGCFMYATGGDA